ncbi:MAG: hypothetical protein JST30_15575 [Armatimonadetes bacterium]|nr:hypothetical protein [Armatimonadota bacterium]
MRTSLCLLVAFAACQALPSGLVWSNVVNMPGDLQSTGDGWSATRAEDIGSYRCAADDVSFSRPTRIDSFVYYSIQVGTPDILGGDLYVYTVDNGHPGTLVAARPDLPNAHVDTGLFNNVFNATVYSNTLAVPGLELPAGQYFLAFRTVENRINGQKNGALTTRVAIGGARAQWNFSVSRDGDVGEGWMTMDAFNLVQDQEWAFHVIGSTVVEPVSYTVKLGKASSGDVSSLRSADGDALRVCKFVVPNAQAAPVNVEVEATSPYAVPTSLSFAVRSKMASAGQFAQTLDLYDWNAGAFDPVDTRTDALTTSYSVNELAASGALTRYVRAGDGAVRARYRVRVTGVSSVALWCHDADRAVWYVAP